MIRVENTSAIEVIQIEVQGNDNLGYFSDVIRLIIENHIDLDKNTSIYDICKREVEALNIGSQTIDYAMAYVYDINGNLLNQFTVLD